MGTKDNPGKHDVKLLKLHQDEPFFILRASDLIAPATVMVWANLATTHQVPDDKIREAVEQVNAMVEWQRRNQHLTKIPD